MTRPRGDALAGLAAGGFFVVAVLVGAVAGLAGHPVHAGAAPLFAHWMPHLGPGTLPALTVAALVIWRGPAQAARLGWRAALAAGYLAAVSWTLALALVDGWQRGLAGRLTTQFEYLSEVPGVPGVPALLHGFAGRIVDGGPDSWTTHVAGHPPGALLVFVALDRIGLGGGGWAAIACVLIGSLVAVAVPVTLRALGSEAAGRAAIPFLVIFPGAVWIGASADGMFAGVAAGGLALLAIGLTRRSPAPTFAAGLVLGFAVYLSYGLVLLAPLALAVLVLAGRRIWFATWAVAGAAVVVGAFTAGGFWWVDGYHLVQVRYYQGLASQRPYTYWVWANLAALVASAGPAAAPMLRRATLAVKDSLVRLAVTDPMSRRGTGAGPDSIGSRSVERILALGRARPGRGTLAGEPAPVVTMSDPAVAAPAVGGVVAKAAVWLPVAAFAAILLADLSGLSKAETERIWLPFAVWLPAAAVLLPSPARRSWLAVQAVTALLINHLLLTTW